MENSSILKQAVMGLALVELAVQQFADGRERARQQVRHGEDRRQRGGDVVRPVGVERRGEAGTAAMMMR